MCVLVDMDMGIQVVLLFLGMGNERKAHEGALTPPGIIRRNPQVPHTAREVTCHPVNNWRGKQRSIPPHKTRPDSPVRTLQRNCDPSQIWPRGSQETLIKRLKGADKVVDRC